MRMVRIVVPRMPGPDTVRGLTDCAVAIER